MYRTFRLKASDELRQLVPVVPTQKVDGDLITATVQHVSPVVNADHAAGAAYRHWCIMVSQIDVSWSGHPVEAIAGNIRRGEQVAFGAARIKILLTPPVDRR